MNNSRKIAIIVGSCGMIGCHLERYGKTLAPVVFVTEKVETRETPNLIKPVKPITFEITSRELLDFSPKKLAKSNGKFYDYYYKKQKAR